MWLCGNLCSVPVFDAGFAVVEPTDPLSSVLRNRDPLAIDHFRSVRCEQVYQPIPPRLIMLHLLRKPSESVSEF
jgi:hypothetical protein